MHLFSLLAFSALSFIAADPITVPSFTVTGKCSPSAVTGIKFTTELEAPGVQGVYLLSKPDYDKLKATADVPSLSKVKFDYYAAFSCDKAPVQDCAQDSTVTQLNEVLCVAIVNSGPASMNGDLTVSFITAVAGTKPAGNSTATTPSKTSSNQQSATSKPSSATHSQVHSAALVGLLAATLLLS
jgi:hypothetical protein